MQPAVRRRRYVSWRQRCLHLAAGVQGAARRCLRTISQHLFLLWVFAPLNTPFDQVSDQLFRVALGAVAPLSDIWDNGYMKAVHLRIQTRIQTAEAS